MTPACVTTTEVSATVSVALRGDVVGFGATVNVSMPPPLPVEVLSVAHETGLWAVHAHPVPAITQMPAVELPPPTVTEVGDTK